MITERKKTVQKQEQAVKFVIQSKLVDLTFKNTRWDIYIMYNAQDR